MVYLLCGKKGSRKSLFLTSFLNKHKKRYDHFFSNFPVCFCKQIDSFNWVFYKFPENSAIFLDESQLYYNSRKFSELTKSGVGVQLLDFLTMCRHYKIDIFFITQSANRVDLQIRELADYVFYIKRVFSFFGRPFLVYGLHFLDIIEFEKFMNPNNFSNDFACSYLFKFILKKDLKSYDTNYIDNSYLQKELIPFSFWRSGVSSDTPAKKKKNLKKYFKIFFNKFIIFFKSYKKNKNDELKYF